MLSPKCGGQRSAVAGSAACGRQWQQQSIVLQWDCQARWPNKSVAGRRSRCECVAVEANLFLPYPVCCLPNVEGNAPPLPGQPRVAGSGNNRALPSNWNVRAGGRTSLSQDGEAVVNVWLLRQTCFFRIPYAVSQMWRATLRRCRVSRVSQVVAMTEHCPPIGMSGQAAEQVCRTTAKLL